MSNGNREQRRAWVAGTIVATILLASIPSATAASTISPKKWAKSFCNTIGDFGEELVEISDDIVSTNSEATANLAVDPSGIFDVIESVAGFLDDSADTATEAADGIRSLPKPDVGGGGKIKRVLSRILGGGLDDVAFEFEAGATDLRSIADQTTDPVVAAQLFQTASTELAATFSDASATISDGLNSVPDDGSIDPDKELQRALRRSKACARLSG